jgi:hypothetical protein
VPIRANLRRSQPISMERRPPRGFLGQISQVSPGLIPKAGRLSLAVPDTGHRVSLEGFDCLFNSSETLGNLEYECQLRLGRVSSFYYSNGSSE